MRMNSVIILVACILFLLNVVGCAAQMTTSGWASVSQLYPNGGMLMVYSDGKTSWKAIEPNNIRKEFEIVAKNIGKPARYVETKRGSTLSFPNGDTIHYRNASDEKVK
jgi:hypothetical protein